jgi:hypothetical protein
VGRDQLPDPAPARQRRLRRARIRRAAGRRQPGPVVKLSFDVNDDIAAPYIKKGVRPQVAVLREQGVNGQVEMAAAFDRAGFARSTCT